MAKRKPEKTYYFEAVDRLHVLQQVLEDHVIKHPVVQYDKEVMKKLVKAQELMGSAYQDLSQHI